jgi:hypothetical protein
VHDIVLDRWMSWGCEESPRCSLIVLADTWTPAIEKAVRTYLHTPILIVCRRRFHSSTKCTCRLWAKRSSRHMHCSMHRVVSPCTRMLTRCVRAYARTYAKKMQLKSPVKEWNVEDLLWYFGNEAERKCQTR